MNGKPAAGRSRARPTGQRALRATDARGEEIVFGNPARRVACVTSNGVDVLAQLGIVPVALLEQDGASLARRPEFFGARADGIPRIRGSWFEPNLEDVIAAKPDLVIGFAGVQDALCGALGGVAPVFMIATSTHEDAAKDVESLGELTDLRERAASSVTKFREKLRACSEASPRTLTPLVVYGTGEDDLGVSTAGSMAGSVLAAVTDYPWSVPQGVPGELGGDVPCTAEQIAEADPDALFVETKRDLSGNLPRRPLSEQLAGFPGWDEMRAVRNGRVREVDADVWHSGGGLRSLGLVLDEAMYFLYPGAVESGRLHGYLR